jgi:hypothetical protein
LQHDTHNSPSFSARDDIDMLRTQSGLTRSNQVTEMLRTSVPVCVVAVLLTIGVPGCDKKSGEAVVLSKEHIDAAPPTKDT